MDRPPLLYIGGWDSAFTFAPKNSKTTMGVNYRRRKKIAPGVHLNTGKTGASLTFGRRGASVNVGKRGAYANIGLPGTGLSYRTRVDKLAPKPNEKYLLTGTGCLSWISGFMLLPLIFGLISWALWDDKAFAFWMFVAPSSAIIGVCYYFFRRGRRRQSSE